uniref:uncharacterized protein LOC122595877 n=1 Tax=Erigeron canadensis TaxID=72917 RepID=UPI001CB93503|nr:uncharacterized protein LOC122595877 [Erigeron canadensis]
MWRVELDRLPTCMALKIRNCNFGSLMCGLCNNEEETVEHLFCSCTMAMDVWYHVGVWCKSPSVFLFDIKDIFELHKMTGFCKERRSTFKGIVSITWWILWKTRNDTVFNKEKPNIEKIVQNIKDLSFLWYRVKKKKDVITWDKWCCFDIV